MKFVRLLSLGLFFVSQAGQAQDTEQPRDVRTPVEARVEMARMAKELSELKTALSKLEAGTLNVNLANCTESGWRARVDLETRYACGENQFIREIRFAHQFQMNLTFQESVQIVCCSIGGGIVPKP